MKYAIEIDHVSYSFRSGFFLKPKLALENIHLSVKKESIFGFLGPNGAGKTTLIHLMTGLRQPTAGNIKIFNHAASSCNAKAKIGFLPERPYFPNYLTGEEILKYFGILSGMDHKQIQSRMSTVLRLVGMKDAKNTLLKNYSKGMLQRIGIAQALIHDPELLILDEPMSGLDPLGRKEMRDLILQLAQEGRTIFFTSHVIPDVEAICHEIAILKHRKIIASGTLDKILNSHLKLNSSEDILDKELIEIRFSGLSELKESAWPEFQSIQKIQNEWKGIVVGQKNVQLLIEKLIKKSASITWITPQRPSLENLLIENKLEKSK